MQGGQENEKFIDREQFVFEKKSPLDLGVFRMGVAESLAKTRLQRKKNLVAK